MARLRNTARAHRVSLPNAAARTPSRAPRLLLRLRAKKKRASAPPLTRKARRVRREPLGTETFHRAFVRARPGPARRQARHELVTGSERAYVAQYPEKRTSLAARRVARRRSRLTVIVGLSVGGWRSRRSRTACACRRPAGYLTQRVAARDANVVQGFRERLHAGVHVQPRLGGGDDGSRGARDILFAAFDVARREHAHAPAPGVSPRRTQCSHPRALAMPVDSRRSRRDSVRHGAVLRPRDSLVRATFTKRDGRDETHLKSRRVTERLRAPSRHWACLPARLEPAPPEHLDQPAESRAPHPAPRPRPRPTRTKPEAPPPRARCAASRDCTIKRAISRRRLSMFTRQLYASAEPSGRNSQLSASVPSR